MNKILLALFFYFSLNNIFSTHIVGGDIAVKHISGNTFEVTMHIYRDCLNGQQGFENPSTLGLYDLVTHAQVFTFPMPLISQTILQFADSCKPQSNVCVEDGLFITNITIPNNPNGYYLSWLRCCRNTIITNIVNPAQAGTVLYCEIPDPAIQNSTPVFNFPYPNPVFCSSLPNVENFSATDIDGDQLVYSLVAPLNTPSPNPPLTPPTPGPYSDVQFVAPYSNNDMVGGMPIMSVSGAGILSASPNIVGVYVFAVRIEEYRNGIKIGEIRREMQYVVYPCPLPDPPTATSNLCGNQILTADSGFNYYSWTDSTTGTTTGIVGSSMTQSITVNQTGTYQVVMGPSVTSTCTHIAYVSVIVNQKPTATFTSNVVCIGTPTQFTDNSFPALGGSISSWSWDFNNDGISDNTTQNPSFTFPNAGTHQVALIVSQGPCSDTITINVTVEPVANVNAGPDQTICDGGSVTLAAIFGGSASAGAWSGGSGVFSPNNSIPNATYTPSVSEIVAGSVTLTFTTNANPGPCVTNSDQVTIYINSSPTANAGPNQRVCEGDSFILNGTIAGAASSATWVGGTGNFIPNNTTLNATYVPSATDIANGSIVLSLITNDPPGPCLPDTAFITLNFYPKPVVNFNVDIPKGCPVHCVSFMDASAVSFSSSINSWSWNFGDGNSSSIQNPSHCYVNTGLYDVTLSVITNNGCKDTLTKNQFIEVYAKPLADFYANPNPATSLNSMINFYNQSSSDVVYWYWNFGDGTSHSDSITANPSHLYSSVPDIGYIVNLIVQNANGCKDTIEKGVTVKSEFSFYIPNAFTPNEDGINDEFNGKGVGISNYNIWIFDRWGEEIWKSDKIYPHDAWNGTVNGENEIVQQDVYVWKVLLTDVFGKTHKYIGTVTVIK